MPLRCPPPRGDVNNPQAKKDFIDVQPDARIPARHLRRSLRGVIVGMRMIPMVLKVKCRRNMDREYHAPRSPPPSARSGCTAYAIAGGRGRPSLAN